MSYCTECGVELSGEPAYCPECGTKSNQEQDPTEEQVNHIEEQSTSEQETASCRKCESQILASAERCSHCGYEPSDGGPFMTLRGLVYGTWTVAGLLLYVAAFSALAMGDYTIPNFLMALVLITTFILYPLSWIVIKSKKANATATEEITILGNSIN